MIGIVVVSRDDSCLEQCLNSLIKQDIAKQILLIDDGSQPPVDLPVDIVRFDTSQGVQRARNYGYQQLKQNPYLLFCDGDIIWKSQALNKLRSALEDNPKKAYAYCGYQRSGVLAGQHNPGPFNASRLRNYNYVSTMSLVCTTTLPEPPFMEDEERLQDWSLWLRMLRNGHEGVNVPEILFTANFDTTSISTQSHDHYQRWYTTIRGRYGLW